MKYELMLILSSKLTDKEIEKTLKEVKDSLTENSCEIIAEDIWGRRDLAYKIKGQQSGYYILLNFESDGKGVPEVQKDLRIQVGVLRSLLIKIPDFYRLTRYEETAKPSTKKLTSKHAEELQKKVTKKAPVKDKEEKAEVKDEKLDEKLSAIINNTDLEI